MIPNRAKSTVCRYHNSMPKLIIFLTTLCLFLLLSTNPLSAERLTLSEDNIASLQQFDVESSLVCLFINAEAELGTVNKLPIAAGVSKYAELRKSQTEEIAENLNTLNKKELKKLSKRKLLYKNLTRKKFSNFRKLCKRFEPTPTAVPTATATSTPTRPVTASVPNLAFTSHITGLTQPLYLTHSNDNTGRLFVIERSGIIKLYKNGALSDFLNITAKVGDSAGEQGLLSVAFHPSYTQNGKFYVNYTDNNGDTVVSEFLVSTNPDIADSGTERIILTQAQPASNHNGGLMKFGPDRFLYIAFGDGGASGARGQDLTTLLGGLVRIDINQGNPYAVPSDNPFIGVQGARTEKWAYGMRNPWRFSFDRLNGTLFLADVGQNDIEEVDIVTKGGNYGWNTMEGSSCFSPSTNCNQTGLSLPISEYSHSEGNSITGGYVYRGAGEDNFYGKYVFGDFGTGRVWVLIPESNGTWRRELVQDTNFNISSFGEDESGNIYLVHYGGIVYRVSEM